MREILAKLTAEKNNLLRLSVSLTCDKFAYLYERASPERQKVVEGLTIARDADGVKKWMEDEQGEYSIRDLREAARAVGVPNWSRKSKRELTAEIAHYEANKTHAKGFVGPGTDDD